MNWSHFIEVNNCRHTFINLQRGYTNLSGITVPNPIDNVPFMFYEVKVARIFKFLVLALIAGFSGAAVTVALHLGIAPESLVADDLSYSDFLSIMLTALGLMITVLGFFVAAAGVIGWTTLENKLRSHSIEYFQEQLKKDAKLRRELEEIIIRIGYDGIENFKSQHGIDDRKQGKAPEEEEYND